MTDKITMMKDFNSVESKGDVTLLLKEIRIIGFQIETNTSVYNALDEAHAMYYAYKQEPGESNAKHLRNFKSIVAAVEHLGGAMFADDALIIMEKKTYVEAGGSPKSDAFYKKMVKDKMMGVAFLKLADQQRYSTTPFPSVPESAGIFA